MRLVALYLVIGAAVPTYAQSTLPDLQVTAQTRQSQDPLATRISVSFSDAPLRQALSKIAEQSHLRLMYSSDDLPGGRLVSLSAVDVTVGAALQVMLANTRLQPVVMGDGAVVLTTERPKPGATQEPSEGATAQTRGTAAFEGRVIRPDGTPAAGASIDVLGSSDSAATTDSGRFVLHNLAPGSHTLLIRQMGFRPALVSITMTDVQSNTLSITLVRAVPVLPTVVTTSDVQAAYQSAGLSQRMRAGLGQFLTYDQIEQRQARKLSELLEGLRGIQVFQHPRGFEASVGGTRGPGSCVAFVVDGVPQNMRYSQDALGAKLPPDDADNMIDPSGVGAIEVYSAAERPAGLEAAGRPL